jgi:hypothetical protein
MAIDHPHDALPPGYRLGSYEILRVLGRGGFPPSELSGKVFLDDDLPPKAGVPGEVSDAKAAGPEDALNDELMEMSSRREGLAVGG